VLPNLIVIGAAKCGTTSLHEYLDLHPEISMSREKELNFFVPEKNLGRGVDWYKRQFRDAPIRGESSPSYAAYPNYDGVPDRIRELIPEVQLVYLVRDPIERVISHYLHRVSTHPGMAWSLDEMLDDPRDGAWLVSVSRYWLQLQRYLGRFSEEQILVVDSHELHDQRAQTLRRIFGFLGVDPLFDTTQFSKTHNAAPRPSRRTPAGERIFAGLALAVGRARATELIARSPSVVRAPFRREVERPVVSASTRNRLASVFGPEVEALRRETGLPLASWSI
jgi:hypothetical protein